MRNKRFPNYPDDVDYTTNAPSYYEDLARKEKLIRLLAERIWGYEEILDETLEEIQERFRAWDKNLEDFPEDVKILLQQWLDDGTLDHIINETIFNWKLDTTIFEQFRDSTTAQLQQTTIRLDDNPISPDDFEGSDVQKITQAITQAVLTKRAIKLARVYDMTGSLPIPLNLELENRYPIEFLGQGGGFFKGDDGFVFDNPVWTGDIIFDSVRFTGNQGAGGILLNGDKILRVKFNNCFSNGLDHLVIAEKEYLQSYHINGGTYTHFSGDGLIMTPGSYDLQIGGGVLVEKGETFFRQTPILEGGYTDTMFTTRFTDITVEGLSGYAFFFRKVDILKISGIYFEKNRLGDIHCSNGSYDGVHISDIRNYENQGTTTTKKAVVYLDGVFHDFIAENIRTNEIYGIYSLASTNSLNMSCKNIRNRGWVDNALVDGEAVFDYHPVLVIENTTSNIVEVNPSIKKMNHGVYERYITLGISDVNPTSFRWFNMPIPFTLRSDFIYNANTNPSPLGVYVGGISPDRTTNTVRVKVVNDTDAIVNVRTYLNIIVFKNVLTI